MDKLQEFTHLAYEARESRDNHILLRDIVVLAELLLIESSSPNTPEAVFKKEEFFPLLSEMIELFSHLNDLRPVTRFLHRLARWMDRLGYWDVAVRYYDKMEELAERNGDSPGVIHALEERGDIHRKQGNLQGAEACQKRAYDLARDHDEVVLKSHACNNIGVILIERGDLNMAEGYFDKALEELEYAPERLLEGHVYNNLGVLKCIRGEPVDAYRDLNRALNIRREIGDRNGSAETLHNIGMAMFEAGNFDEAGDYYEQALSHAHDLGNSNLEANIRLSRGELEYRRGNNPTAMKYAGEALSRYESSGDQLGIIDAGRIIGLIHHAENRFEESRRRLTAALELAEKHRHPLLTAQCAESLGMVELETGNSERATECLRLALNTYGVLENSEAVRGIKLLAARRHIHLNS